MQCGRKNPKSDGFNFNFIKKTLIKYDVIEALNYFQQSGSIPNGCNASLVTL